MGVIMVAKTWLKLAEIMFTNISVRWIYGLKRDFRIFATDSYKHELKDQTVK